MAGQVALLSSCLLLPRINLLRHPATNRLPLAVLLNRKRISLYLDRNASLYIPRYNSMLTVHFDKFPVLQTSRLLLRQPTHADADALFRLRSSDEVMQYIGRPKPQSREDMISYIDRLRKDFEQSTGITWIIATGETDTAIGTVGFWRIDKEHHRAEIGYLLDPAYQGKGLAGEALQAALSYGFNELKVHAVEAHVNPLNVASKKLLLKAGFLQEGYFRECYYFDGKFSDSAIFGLLHHEYRPGKEKQQ